VSNQPIVAANAEFGSTSLAVARESFTLCRGKIPLAGPGRLARGGAYYGEAERNGCLLSQFLKTASHRPKVADTGGCPPEVAIRALMADPALQNPRAP
jgi:hypothetical protein